MAYHGGETVHCDDVPWLPLAPKIGVRILKLDHESGGFSVMIRAEAGGILPRHSHIESAEIYVLQGQGTHAQTGAYQAGDYISEPKGALHDALAFDQETVLLMICQGPSAFLGDDDSVQHIMDIPMLEHLSAAYAGGAA
ncbi:cupin domain-containing protein [Brevundimonas sanguinis]|uniref:cupin domain-containing protein n=1 Tax=Brevundimonas sanguinis TaxID=3021811 RepID=UPI002415342E|nr:cupin domain-containing protein [Brevundimonas sp. NCCP 15609]